MSVATPVKQQNPRNKMLVHLGMTIPPARVRKLLDKQGLNSGIQKQIVELKAKQLAYQKGDVPKSSEEWKKHSSAEYKESHEKYLKYKDVNKQRNALADELVPTQAAPLDAQLAELKLDQYVQLKLRILELSKERFRFNDQVCVILSTLIQHILTEVILHSIKKVRQENKKIVTLMHCGGLEELPIFPFIHVLPSLQKLQKYTEAINEHQITIDNYRKLSKKCGEEDGAKKAEYEAKLKQLRENTPVFYEKKEGYMENDELFYYTHYVRKAIKRNLIECTTTDSDREFYESVRLSQEYRHFLSELMVEFIKRLCPYICTLLKLMNIKTINKEVLFSTLRLMMLDCGRPFEPVQELLQQKMEQYEKYMREKSNFDSTTAPVVAESTPADAPAVVPEVVVAQD